MLAATTAEARLATTVAAAFNSFQLKSIQLNSIQLDSTQFNTTQFNSIELNPACSCHHAIHAIMPSCRSLPPLWSRWCYIVLAIACMMLVCVAFAASVRSAGEGRFASMLFAVSFGSPLGVAASLLSVFLLSCFLGVSMCCLLLAVDPCLRPRLCMSLSSPSRRVFPCPVLWCRGDATVLAAARPDHGMPRNCRDDIHRPSRGERMPQQQHHIFGQMAV